MTHKITLNPAVFQIERREITNFKALFLSLYHNNSYENLSSLFTQLIILTLIKGKLYRMKLT